MSREQEIRERLEAVGELDQWYSADESTESLEYAGVDADALGPDADLIANAPADLAYLLAENTRLRAQLDTVREVADTWERVSSDDANRTTSFGFAATVIRAALNQGGETNGE